MFSSPAVLCWTRSFPEIFFTCLRCDFLSFPIREHVPLYLPECVIGSSPPLKIPKRISTTGPSLLFNTNGHILPCGDTSVMHRERVLDCSRLAFISLLTQFLRTESFLKLLLTRGTFLILSLSQAGAFLFPFCVIPWTVFVFQVLSMLAVFSHVWSSRLVHLFLSPSF